MELIKNQKEFRRTNAPKHLNIMIIGIPREIKAFESRVALTPAGVETLTNDSHRVLVETGAGENSGFLDAQYQAAGAALVDVETLWQDAEMVVKVKEPLPQEWPRMRAGQIVFTYFHFAADEKLTRAVQDAEIVALAYETVQETNGTLPLLVPMSEVAGRMAVQEGAKYLERTFGGRGILLSGVPGTPRAQVMVLGAGIVGSNSARLAAGLGANVSIYDVNLERLRYLDDTMPPNVTTRFSDPHAIRTGLLTADLVIGSVLLPGKRAPKLVRRSDLKTMQTGAVLVDVAIDQGGCFESSHPTSHDAPTFVEEGIVHYCVTNMPGAVPRTATLALTNATFPWVRKLASTGWKTATENYPVLAHGLNIVEGEIVHPGVLSAWGS